MEKQKAEVISYIRACLNSLKGRATLRQLDNDYRTLVGERIPFGRLGFSRLEELLKTEPSLIISKSGTETWVDAKASEKSSHIAEMVQKQKTSKKVIQKAVRFHVTASSQSAQARWRPKDANNRFNKKYQTSSRPAAVSHNQFVDRSSYRQPSVPSKVVVPPNNQNARVTNHFQPAAAKKPDMNDRLNVNRMAVRNGPSVTVSVQNINVTAKTAIPSAPPLEDNNDILVSTKKRLAKKMSQMSVERDSGNSSPTSEVPSVPIPPTVGSMQLPNMTSHFPIEFAPKIFNSSQSVPLPSPTEKRSPVPEFVASGNPVLDLGNFVDLHKLGVLDVSVKQMRGKKYSFFMCKIKVAGHIYCTYPQEFPDGPSAQRQCSEKALTDLVEKYGRRKSLLLASVTDILERIPPMLEKHPHGIWGWQLELDYADKYHEQLPQDWLKIIDSSDTIQVEKCFGKYVLRHCKPGDKGQKWNALMAITDVSVPANTVRFGDDGKLCAQVTCIMSANEIWCQQCDTPEFEQFCEMVGRMTAFYDMYHFNLKASTISLANYYVARYENSWYRIRAVEITDTEVHCFFIDYGDETMIAKEFIYQLKREFASSQAQAFVSRLVGLEELYETSTMSETMQNYLWKYYILEDARENLDETVVDPTTPVYMYDYNTGQSINEELIPLLTMESASPTLVKDTISEVYVSNIEDNGDVYVQVHSHGFESLQDLLENLESQINQNPPNAILGPVTKENSADKLYFAKYKVDSHWYRAKIIDWSPQGDLAQIYFVDYGNADVINVQTEVLYPLHKLSDVLSQYPHQAVKVRMSLDVVPSDFVKIAEKLMPLNQPVLLKIIDYDNEKVPWVEFFKRSSDGGLFCINKSIAVETELKKGDGNNNSPKGPMRKLAALAQFDNTKNVPSGGSLKRPQLPKKGEFFEVLIPFAVNPWNFFVQPLASNSELNQLMEALQERFGDVQYSPLQLADIIPGKIYASKHDDGIWYRTSVIKVIHSGSISVFYCDFGYYANLTVQQLLPLDLEFTELPYQALKAKLSGIKPLKNKWSMEDCEYFKELVMRKAFYSTLKDIEKDELYESDIVLNLIIIDTSTDEDINIENELIRKNIAVRV